jgi:hypothetical protein
MPEMTLVEFVAEFPALVEAYAEAAHRHGVEAKDPLFTTPRPLVHWLDDLAAYVRCVELEEAHRRLDRKVGGK